MASELWQRLGHTSYGEWVRASEKARRDAKKARRDGTPRRPAPVLWQAPQVLVRPPSPSPTARAAVFDAERPSLPLASTDYNSRNLPGRVSESVLVTPRGRRAHKFKHISPGGTTRIDEYFSPACAHDRVCEQRLACLRRMSGTRRAEAPVAALNKRARFDAEPPRSPAALAASLKHDMQNACFTDPRPRCGFRVKMGLRVVEESCSACAFAAVPGQAPPDWAGGRSFCRQHAPCEEKLSRLGYRKSEFATVYKLQGSYVQYNP